MGFTEAISTVYSKYATFTGRAKRPEFWYFVLLFVLIYIAAIVIASVIGDPTIPMIILGIFAVGSIIPNLAVTVRRLHDQDKSGWWWFIQFVPIVGGIWFIVLMCLPGTPGPNRFDA